MSTAVGDPVIAPTSPHGTDRTGRPDHERLHLLVRRRAARDRALHTDAHHVGRTRTGTTMISRDGAQCRW